MAFVFFMTLPGLTVGLVALAALDRLGLWIHGRSGLPWHRDGRRPATAAGLDELQAAFHSGSRHVVERRNIELVLRDEEQDGAPPRTRIDLGTGLIVITRAAAPRSADAEPLGG